MKKISFLSLMLFSTFITGAVFAQTQNYFGASGELSGSYWNTTDAAPFTQALVTTGGPVWNFNTVITTSPNLANEVLLYGINVTQDVTLTRTGGIIRNYNNTGNMIIDVSAGKTFDCSAATFSGVAAAAQTKNGSGTLVTYGGTFGGGYTLNAGTIVAKSNIAMGGNAVTAPLNINGGTIASNATLDFSSKYSAINVGGDFTLGSTVSPALTTAYLTFNANTVLGSATRTISIGGTGIYTLGGVISGDAGVGLTVNATAAGYLKLSGANTYTGTTTINSGTVQLGSSSALGTVDGGTVVASGCVLDLNGINYSTVEPLTLNGTGISGSGVLRNNSASATTFSGPITLGASGAMFATSSGTINLTNSIGGTGSLTLGGNGVNGGSISGVIANSANIIKFGASTWTISAANTYTGTTSITDGILCMGASGVIPDASAIYLYGGTLCAGATTGFSETVGQLSLQTNNSTIKLGTGSHSLRFADSHLTAWTVGKVLNITGWVGSGSQSGTEGRIFVGTDASGLSSTQLDQITFAGFNAGAELLSTGELVPKLATAVNNSSLDLLSVKVISNSILVNGISDKATASIYSVNGQLIKSVQLGGENNSIPMTQEGIYIVKIAEKVFKVVL